MWLRAHSLLRSINNEESINQVYNDILSSFKTKRDILNMIINSASIQQLNHLIEILKTTRDKDMEIDIGNNNNHNYKKSYFEELPIESIHNVMDYLTRYDITKLNWYHHHLHYYPLKE